MSQESSNKVLRGMAVHHGPAARRRAWVRSALVGCVRQWGFDPVETPIVEPRAVFTHAVGGESDIVTKEMFRVFGVKDDTDWVLRPEATASVVRTRVQEGQAYTTQKNWYWGPMFRYERPQKGRLRQFTQFGIESFGNATVSEDIQILLMGQALMDLLPEATVRLELGSLGCDTCRPVFRDTLVQFLRQHAAHLCGDCVRRTETNPLRALDCKVPACGTIYQNAPSMQDALCDDCRTRQETTTAALDKAEVQYTINPTLVRGLDYYRGVVFEWTTDKLGAKAAVCAGGRFDRLSTLYGKEEVPAIGFALGVERFDALLGDAIADDTDDLRLLPMGADWEPQVQQLLQQARDAGLRAVLAQDGRSIKARMRAANREGVRFVAVIGSEELANGILTIKDLGEGDPVEVSVDGFAAWCATQAGEN